MYVIDAIWPIMFKKIMLSPDCPRPSIDLNVQNRGHYFDHLSNLYSTVHVGLW